MTPQIDRPSRRPRVNAAVARLLLVLAACCAGCGPRVDPGAPTRISLDASVRYQTIDGWAVYPRYWEEDKTANRFDSSFEPYLQTAADSLVNQVGINAVRLEISSGMENPVDRWASFHAGGMTYTEWAHHRYEKINDNADPYSANLSGFRFERLDYQYERIVLLIKQALAARGEQLYINVCYVDFNTADIRQGPLSHADNPDEFAELVLVYFEHLRDKYGITPDAFEIVLEPENTERWRGAQIGRGLIAVSDRLAQKGFRPQFIAPSNTSTRGAIRYFDAMMRVPGVAGRFHTFAYHRYGESTSDVEDIHERAQAHGLKTAMLEKVDAGIDALIEDLTVGHVSSWQQWALAGSTRIRDNGGYYLRIDPASPSDNPRITLARHTAQLAQVFLFVRRGAVRINATSDNPDKRPVAFVNPNGNWVVVVRAVTAGGPLRLEGLPAGRYGTRLVNDTRVSSDLPPITVADDGVLVMQIPEAGVTTLYRMP